MKMNRLSSNWTLFYRLFLPTFWIVLFGGIVLTVWFLKGRYFGPVSAVYVRAIITSFYVTSLLILYFTVIQLKRVEMSREVLYVTNYFKHIRYPINAIEKISETDLWVIKLGKVTLKENGSFGKNLHFLVSRSEYPIFWDQNPALNQKLRKQKKSGHEI